MIKNIAFFWVLCSGFGLAAMHPLKKKLLSRKKPMVLKRAELKPFTPEDYENFFKEEEVFVNSKKRDEINRPDVTSEKRLKIDTSTDNDHDYSVKNNEFKEEKVREQGYGIDQRNPSFAAEGRGNAFLKEKDNLEDHVGSDWVLVDSFKPLTIDEILRSGNADKSNTLVRNPSDDEASQVEEAEQSSEDSSEKFCEATEKLYRELKKKSPKIKVVKELLKQGADADSKVGQYSFLYYAVKKDNAELLKVLLNDLHVDFIPKNVTLEDTPEVDCGASLLQIASRLNRKKIAKYLIEDGICGVDFRCPGSERPPLVLAALKGHTQMCKLLVDNGASIDILDSNRWTPLTHAAKNGHAETCRYLLSRGACVNVQGDYRTYSDWTPLHYAAQNCDMDVCKVLLENGADPNTGCYATPFSLAVKNSWNKDDGWASIFIECFLKYGADPYKCNYLKRAAKDGRKNTCKALLYCMPLYEYQKDYEKAHKGLITLLLCLKKSKISVPKDLLNLIAPDCMRSITARLIFKGRKVPARYAVSARSIWQVLPEKLKKYAQEAAGAANNDELKSLLDPDTLAQSLSGICKERINSSA